jgi:hypothetical protein
MSDFWMCFFWVIVKLQLIALLQIKRSRDSAVDIATGYGLDDWGVGVRVPVGSRIFSSPNRTDRLRGPPNLQSNGYRGGSFPEGKAAGARSWPLISRVPRSRKCGFIHPLPHTPSWRRA